MFNSYNGFDIMKFVRSDIVELFDNDLIRFNGSYRPYQQRILDNLNEYSLNDKIHLVAPPGSGKTTLGLEIIKRLNKNALILTPTLTIREQWIERFVQDFLIDKALKDKFISNDLKKPAPIICITYQALYSAYMQKINKYQDEENLYEEENDFSDFNLIETLISYNIKTICLDECHHLRSEWWKALDTTLKKIKDVKTISLTATPPYDSNKSEWQKYIDLCGPIDDEIFTPELIYHNNLACHQDFIYLNYPTKDELEIIEKFNENAKKIFIEYQHSTEIIKILQKEQLTFNDFKNKYYENPDFYRAKCIFLNHNDIKQSYILKKFIRLEPFDIKHFECLLNNIIFNEKYKNEPFIQQFKRKLISLGLVNKHTVYLTNHEKINKILIQSQNKLNSINEIVAFEYSNLKEKLRLLILTDYIKKEQKKNIDNLDKEIKSIGTIPIFESLRRKNILGLKMCVLSGSIAIIPNDKIELFNKLTNNQFSFSKLKSSNYSEIILSSSNRRLLVSTITKMFQDGEFNIVIGTKSLLGEGWDSPCINTLILASYVDSYIASNQTRGRAIRVDTKNPNKVANIYHLICLNPYNVQESEDYLNVRKRCKTFLGLAYRNDRIENGEERLRLFTSEKNTISKNDVLLHNQEILKIAKNRQETQKRWLKCLNDSKSVEMVCNCLITDKNYLRHTYTFYNSLLQLLLFFFLQFSIIQIYLAFPLRLIGHIILVLSTFVITLFIIKFILRVYKLATHLNKLKYLGIALFNALKVSGVIKSKNAYPKVFRTNKNRYLIYLKDATTHEQNIFIESLKQMLSNYQSPRYLLAKPKSIGRREFFVIPDMFKKNKESAFLLTHNMDVIFGHYEQIFAKNEYGKAIALYAQYLFYKRCDKALLIDKKVLIPKDELIKENLKYEQ